MKRMTALVLLLAMMVSLCVSPAWGADEATEQAAQEFIDTYLSNDDGSIIKQVKGYDGSLRKMLSSQDAWNALDAAVRSRVNELVAADNPDLSYETLLEWTQGFMFMVNYLIVEGDNYEGYIISTDSTGGTLVDPDPPYNTYAVHPFTHEIWQRIVAAEEDFNALSDDAKEYLEKLMTEEGFGLNNGVQPETLEVCNFSALLTAAKKNLEAYENIGNKLEEAGVEPEGANQLTAEMVDAIAGGKKIEVEVKAEMVVKDTVNSDKKVAFEQELKEQGYTGYNIDRYLEIEVLMTVQGFDPVLASRTVEPIWIDLGEAKGGFDYAVLREHAGELTLLAGNQYVVVSGDGHVYVKSDLFSTYAVVAKSKTTGVYVGGYAPESTVSVEAPKTFDAGVGVYAVTAILSMTGMAWVSKKRK